MQTGKEISRIDKVQGCITQENLEPNKIVFSSECRNLRLELIPSLLELDAHWDSPDGFTYYCWKKMIPWIQLMDLLTIVGSR